MRRYQIKRDIKQIFAITEKNISLYLYVKTKFLTEIMSPVFNIIIFLFIFGALFSVKKNYSIGYWNGENYVLFLLLALSIQLVRTLINRFQILFYQEKYWKTLNAIFVAPVHRYILLFGTILSEMIYLGIPILIIFFIAYFLYPISLLNLLFVILSFIAIIFAFGAFGLIVGIFVISYEKLLYLTTLAIRILLFFSCINYPIQIFPEFFQSFLRLNPFYYLFDLLRLSWYYGINPEVVLNELGIFHIFSVIILSIIMPIFSIAIFNLFYKKFAIRGY